MTKTFCFMFTLAVVPLVTFAQTPATTTPPANPISASEKGVYGFMSTSVIAAAEKMPEANYSFKATPDVRSFGQIVGHVADAQYFFCSTAAGEADPVSGIEKGKTTKAELVAALKDAVAYCNKTLAGMTDAEGGKIVKFEGFNMAKLTVLSTNTAHMYEHYGNIVTYMRLKGLVPPTSEKSAGQ